MMSFRKPVADGNAAPEQVQRSRFQLILDELNEAHRRMDRAAHLFSTLILDVEKGMSFIDKFRRDLTTAIEDAGGTVAIETDIEQQMAEFIPKHIKAQAAE